MIALYPPPWMVEYRLAPAASSSHAAAIHSCCPLMAEQWRVYPLPAADPRMSFHSGELLLT
jgi:hypothetical protein